MCCAVIITGLGDTVKIQIYTIQIQTLDYTMLCIV